MTVIEQLKQGLTIEQALSHFGVSVPPRGRDPVMVNCPWHEDRSPSMAVYRRENRAWCFGCNKGGDVLDVTALFLNCDLKEALNYWIGRLGIEDDRRHDAFREIRERKRLARIKEVARNWKLGTEKIIPPPPAPEYLERWDTIFGEKDEIDDRYYPPSTFRELLEYVSALRGWLARGHASITAAPGLWRYIPGNRKLASFISGGGFFHIGSPESPRNGRKGLNEW